MRVLVACEYSGRVRDAFSERGHYAVSVDLLPSDTWGLHWRGDVFEFIDSQPPFDMMIAFPPCTRLSAIGAAYWRRWEKDGSQDEAIDFFLDLAEEDIPLIAIENPAGIMSTVWRKPDQYIQPWQFGDPWVKRTGLWLKGLPHLFPSQIVDPMGNWVDGGTMRKRGVTGYSEGAYAAGATNKARAHERSKTFPGIAGAMAEQWGSM